MPIDKAQFEKGFDEKEPDHIQREILQFLGQHPDQAFTFTEIVQGIGQFRPQGQGIDFLTIVGVGVYTVSVILALDKLVKKGMSVAVSRRDPPLPHLQRPLLSIRRALL